MSIKVDSHSFTRDSSMHLPGGEQLYITNIHCALATHTGFAKLTANMNPTFTVFLSSKPISYCS